MQIGEIMTHNPTPMTGKQGSGSAMMSRRRVVGITGATFGAMAGQVERGWVPRLVTLVSRHGETHVDVIGGTTFADGQPIRPDTPFR